MNDDTETRSFTTEPLSVASPTTPLDAAAPDATPPTPVTPAAGRPTSADAARRRPPARVRTVVIGLTLLVVSVLSLLSLFTDVHVDGGAVVLGMVVAAGLLLVGGGIAGAVREARAAGGG